MIERSRQAVILTEISERQNVWWEKYIKPYAEKKKVSVEIDTMPDADAPLLSPRTAVLLVRLTLGFVKRYRRQDFIVTFQANLRTAWVGILMRIFRGSNQKHVVLQFHRKEKAKSFSSRFKYLVLRFALRSSARIICSSKAEVRYYEKMLMLPKGKLIFLALCVDPRLLEVRTKSVGNDIYSGRRALRDYGTLVKAMEGMDRELIIIGNREAVEKMEVTSKVKILVETPYWECIRLMASSLLVVIPLEDRRISTGQSVALSAMVLGKAVIITKTGGTQDYVRDGITGILVEPYNHMMLREKIVDLVGDLEKRRRIGLAAQVFAREKYVIGRYLERLWLDLEGLCQARV